VDLLCISKRDREVRIIDPALDRETEKASKKKQTEGHPLKGCPSGLDLDLVKEPQHRVLRLFGSSTNVSATVAIPTTVPLGIYYIGVIVDSGNTVTESDETNNTKVVNSTITAN
jgi:hypothetical protein